MKIDHPWPCSSSGHACTGAGWSGGGESGHLRLGQLLSVGEDQRHRLDRDVATLDEPLAPTSRWAPVLERPEMAHTATRPAAASSRSSLQPAMRPLEIERARDLISAARAR